MKIEIISPEKTLFSGEVEMITLPGTNGSFTILEHHAAIISSLEKGTIVYKINGEEKTQPITEGFIELQKNTIRICVEQ